MLKQRFLLRVMFLAGAITVLSPAAWASSDLAVGVAQNVSEGEYGTNTSTTINYLPFYVKYRQDDLTLRAVVPFISVQSAGALVSGGTVVGHPGMSGGNVRSESGLGDIWLEGRYRLHGEGSAPDIIPYAKAKLGTASRSKGLGTGENDYEGGVGLEWSKGERLFPFMDVGYRVLGQPPGVTLHDIATYDGGFMIKTDSQDWFTAMVAGYQSAVSGQSDALDVIGAWRHSLTHSIDVQAYFDKGLTNGSPNYAVGVGLEMHL